MVLLLERRACRAARGVVPGRHSGGAKRALREMRACTRRDELW